MLRAFYLSIALGVFIVSQQAVFAQDSSKRILRVLTETEDTVSVMTRYDKDGTLFYLHQSFLSYEKGETYVYYEEYRRNRFWTLWRYKEVLKREKRRTAIYDEILDGAQYQYTEEGLPLYYDQYELGEEISTTIAWEYYPDDELKFVTELKDGSFWNFLEYYLPSGEVHDFGDFHDGQGVVIHLDDEGNPCLECQYVGKKYRGRLLCEEEEKE